MSPERLGSLPYLVALVGVVLMLVGAYARSTTSSQTSRTPAGSKTTRTTSDNTVVLTTRGGDQVDAYGATSHNAFEHTGRIEEFLRDKSRGRLFLFSSDWPFGLVACGFGLVWTLVTVLVVRVINGDS